MGRIAYLTAPIVSVAHPAALSNSLTFTLLQKVSPEKVILKKIYLTIRHQNGAADELVQLARITIPYGTVQNVDTDSAVGGIVLPYNGQQIWGNWKIVTDATGSFIITFFPYTNGFTTPYAAGSNVQFSCIAELEILD